MEAGCWDGLRSGANAVLAQCNPVDLISAHLVDGDGDAAWAIYDTRETEVPTSVVESLVKTTRDSHPQRVYDAYPLLVASTLTEANRQAYRRACQKLHEMRTLATTIDRSEGFATYLAALAHEHRRRRSFIEDSTSTDSRDGSQAAACPRQVASPVTWWRPGR